MKRCLPLAILALVAARPALADRLLPAGELAGVSNIPAGRLGQELDAGWAMRLVLGVGRGRFALGAPLEIGGFDSRKPERDTQRLLSLGLGAELWLVVAQGPHAGLRARAGYQWRWLSGEGEVIRRCHEVGGCDGGYWHQEPSYRLAGPSAGLAATWSWRIDDARAGFALEAGVERARVELPGTGAVSGPQVALGLTMWMAPACAQ
jgi:hypothetical protein